MSDSEPWAERLKTKGDVFFLHGESDHQAAQEIIGGQQRDLVVVMEKTQSTNALAKKLDLENFSGQQILLIALEQLGGYGRLDRKWFSKPGACLTFTLVVRDLPLSHPGLLPLMTGCAVAESLKKFIINKNQVDIKWPNDVWISGEKVAGILIENRCRHKRADVFFGVGINVKKMNFPEELQSIATTLSAHCEKEVDPVDVLNCFIGHFNEYLSLYMNRRTSEIVKSFASQSTFAEGKRISAKMGEEYIEGVSAGLLESGELMCVDDQGHKRALHVSEIHQVR